MTPAGYEEALRLCEAWRLDAGDLSLHYVLELYSCGHDALADEAVDGLRYVHYPVGGRHSKRMCCSGI